MGLADVGDSDIEGLHVEGFAAEAAACGVVWLLANVSLQLGVRHSFGSRVAAGFRVGCWRLPGWGGSGWPSARAGWPRSAAVPSALAAHARLG